MAVLAMVLVMLMMVMIMMLVKVITVTMVISDENRQPELDKTFPQDHTTGQTLRLQETLEASDGAVQSLFKD